MGGDSLFDNDRPAKRIKVEAPPNDDVSNADSPFSPLSQALPPPRERPPLAAGPEADAHPPFLSPLDQRPPDLYSSYPLHQQPPAPGPLPQPSHQHEHVANIAVVAAPTVADMTDPWPGHASTLFDASWKWPVASSTVSPSSQMAGALEPGLHVGAAHFFPAPLKSLDSDVPVAIASALPASEFNFPLACPTRGSLSLAPSLPPKRPRFPLATAGDSGLGDVNYHIKDHHSRKGANRLALVSPFKDCVGNFGEAQQRRFNRPFDGKVNGYIKFNWPKDKPDRRPSAGRESLVLDSPNVAELVASTADVDAPQSSLVHLGSAPASMTMSPDLDSNFDFSCFLYGPPSSFELSHPVEVEARAVGAEISTELVPIGAPRKVPKLFGYEAQMDHTDRKFWTFYIRNWCPGRSVLLETNLWLKDFAQMHKSDGVRAAIQSLAGIYIYDYQPIDSIRRRVNERFFEAEYRFSRLLNDPTTAHSEAHANELITMAVILSMQDIVLTERRLRKPHDPRWLSGFKQGELFLQATDRGSRFWKRSNAQFSSLRISQSIIVGRAMILAQPMMKLPSPSTFDPECETSRFGWLLYGTERDMYQIHGGCGFSKKLLHMMSQITYCAARLQQDPENIVVPTTSQYLHAELVQMRQWSSESKDWESAKAGPSITEWVRSVPDGFTITSSSDMTDVTAEAWRLTAIVYLQCRVLRIPRNHPAIVENLADLARCICIMPTSGYQFTAQAPLLPVFMLGMLATNPDHKQVSKTWFDEVVSAPVRSSVPPLYEVLQRVWQWIDTEIEMPTPSTADLTEHIGLRYSWWEQLVEEVDKREHEVLCLT
ncbi:fungal specific transcription factor [Hirsutella rhossiliensis]|uniref:Fungal specific transcription factor domain-containing protein n=1 Tax=Hirsutella rhossiliensis TaxID=111463 RepID=A0A9P8SG52_9HYPO|nr:fungal specific transcription factor domain-containing protein [Hirsutella rhossiliensis]KAH0961623.1 fungal specific transcription factor domain-containing protein [Hirsutella rhossiliensis]